MSEPLLSIVMPTHNRCEYAISAVNSILSLPETALQLVVTDTSDGDDLARRLDGSIDKRLVYRRIDEPLSMTENHNAAMALATGRYLCLIGDDDTVTTEIMAAVRWAEANNVTALSPLVAANYAWPDFRSRYLGKAHAGRVYLRRDFGAVSRHNGRRNLVRALNRAALGTEGLPKIYHGIVRRDIMTQIKERSGAYFHGSSPDVSGAVAVAALCGDYVEIDYPITLPGASGKSNTGRSAMKTHKGTLAGDAHTSRFRNLRWPELIPAFASVETVWAQAVHTTLEQLEPALLEEYNYPVVYAACALKHRDYWSATRAALDEYCRTRRLSSVACYGRFSMEFCRYAAASLVRLARRASKPTAAGGRDFIPAVSDIAAAQVELARLLRQRDHSVETLLATIGSGEGGR